MQPGPAVDHGKNWAKSRDVSFRSRSCWYGARADFATLPSDDMAREPLVRDLCSPGSPGPTQLPRVTAEERAFVEESTQVLHFLNELADIDGPLTPLEMLLDDACLTLRELVYP